MFVTIFVMAFTKYKQVFQNVYLPCIHSPSQNRCMCVSPICSLAAQGEWCVLTKTKRKQTKTINIQIEELRIHMKDKFFFANFPY